MAVKEANATETKQEVKEETKEMKVNASVPKWLKRVGLVVAGIAVGAIGHSVCAKKKASKTYSSTEVTSSSSDGDFIVD